MSYLSKKDRKRVSKLITAKLELMGVKDEITFMGSGTFKKYMKKDSDGKVIMEKNKETGKNEPKLFDVEMPIAMNVMRRTVRELRNSSPETINAFLAMKLPDQAG